MIKALCYITVSIILSGCVLERIYMVVRMVEEIMEE